jgi:hypothetical protein
MLESHFDKTARVDRLSVVLDEEDEPTAKKDYQAYIASLACHIQPLDPSITQDIPGGFGKNFLMFSGPADIIEGDRIFIDSEEYRVIGTERLNFNGHPHQETIIRIF